MNLTSEELSKLENASTGDAWDAIVDEILAARGGEYPPDWYAKVLASGLADRMCGMNIHVNGELKVTAFITKSAIHY